MIQKCVAAARPYFPLQGGTARPSAVCPEGCGAVPRSSATVRSARRSSIAVLIVGLLCGRPLSVRAETAYVVDGNSAITVFDTDSHAVLDTIPLNPPTATFQIIVTPDGKTAYVVGSLGQLYVVDLTSKSVVKVIGTVPLLTKVSLSLDGTRLYALDTVNRVAVFSVATNAEIDSFSLPGFPTVAFDVATRPDGAEIYVATSAGLLVVDTLHRTVSPVPFFDGTSVQEVAVSPDGTTAWVRQGGVYLFDIATRKAAPFSRFRSEGVVFTAQGKKSYFILDDLENCPGAFGPQSWCVGATVGDDVFLYRPPVDAQTDPPAWLAVTPAGKKVFAQTARGVFVISTDTNKVVDLIQGVAPIRTAMKWAFAPASQGTSSATDKLLGAVKQCKSCPCVLGSCPTAADPITIATGNVYEGVTDYETFGPNRLRFARSYNSLASSGTLAGSLGANWRTTFDRYIRVLSATSVSVERGDGRALRFTKNGDTWTSDSDVDMNLTQSGPLWTLVDVDDSVERYASATQTIGGAPVSYGQLTSIRARGGYTQTLQYDAAGSLTSVTDSYGRRLDFIYAGGLIETVHTPDGLVIGFNYDAIGPRKRLNSVTYSTTPLSVVAYVYENALVPFGLTGIVDENGDRFATWTYDAGGRGLTSQHGAGADLVSISYDDTTGNRTVTDALGQISVYKFSTLQGVPKSSEVDRLATATTAAAVQRLTYDANGYIASKGDWNGNTTTFANNAHGQPLLIVEASGTPQARSTAIAYHPTLHLPISVATPGLTTTFSYDESGNLINETQTDTTTTIVPYATAGRSRTWSFTWSNSLPASVRGPRTDLMQETHFEYDASGALTRVTNALGQSVRIALHSAGGQPEEIVEENGVRTTLAYDERRRLVSSILATTNGSLTTQIVYDGSGNLVRVVQPDGSTLANTYDAAHRLTAVTDLFGQTVAYTLDAFGDRTKTATSDGSGKVPHTRSAVFDALGRVLRDVGGEGQTTSYAYDGNGNVLSTIDPLGRVTQMFADPLNRTNRAIDRVRGITKVQYDAHDRPVSVVDSNNGTTTYVYDGFGDVIQQISPDSGKTVYRYDAAGNLVQKVDARNVTANYTYDALDRVLTTIYPGGPAENVTFTYDEAGHGSGIGRLTSVVDAAGTLSRSYDERGNITKERRVSSGTTLTLSIDYDAASRVAAMTYPSQLRVAYTRDAMGRVSAVTATPAGGAVSRVVSGISYLPFGPASAFTYGNGIASSRAFDQDYRLTSLAETGSEPVQALTYSYDAADNVGAIANAVLPGNSQGFGYDAMDRLTSATGGYGLLAYTYSAIGNRLTQTANGATTRYGYASFSNRLTSITAPTATTTVNSSAAGNITNFTPSVGAATTYAYNQANRLASVTTPALLTQYTYDVFGHRLLRQNPGSFPTLYQYGPARELLEERANGTASVDYIYLDGQPIGIVTPADGRLFFVHDDRLGTPQTVTDATQSTVWSASYQPFGETTLLPSAFVQHLRFPGQEVDPGNAMYLNGFRDYMPALGRYVETDPLGLRGGVNTFAYAANNALKVVDLSGTVMVSANYGVTFGLGIPGQRLRNMPFDGGFASANASLNLFPNMSLDWQPTATATTASYAFASDGTTLAEYPSRSMATFSDAYCTAPEISSGAARGNAFFYGGLLARGPSITLSVDANSVRDIRGVFDVTELDLLIVSVQRASGTSDGRQISTWSVGFALGLAMGQYRTNTLDVRDLLDRKMY